MTTLRDILNDLANDILNKISIEEETEVKAIEILKQEIIDEYIQTIKNKLIG